MVWVLAPVAVTIAEGKAAVEQEVGDPVHGVAHGFSPVCNCLTIFIACNPLQKTLPQVFGWRAVPQMLKNTFLTLGVLT